MQMLTISNIEKATIILNHVPKAGGQSLMDLFERIFGKEMCFRSRARDMKTNQYSRHVDELSHEEINGFKFIGGHFDYGYHERIDGLAFYVAVVRDPMERLISDYWFNRKHGRPDLKKMTNEMSLEEYAKSKINNPNSKMGRSGQVQQLSGQPDLETALRIIESDYLIACTTPQLNRCQELIARFFGREDLSPTRQNSNPQKCPTKLSVGLRDMLEERFQDDRRLVSYIEDRFEELSAWFAGKQNRP